MTTRWDSRTGELVLDEDACWELLEDADVGRLALVVVGEPEIFPVNFAVDGRTLLLRTAEGTKLAGMVMHDRVAFEVDGYDAAGGEAWSVVLKGVAHRLERFDDIYAAEDVPLFPWNVTPKQVLVRIVPTSLAGRRFTVVTGPRD
jgi:nitroimidazol reductase NimA-like FMN-containing flavoprotein (pyridoxamine 5'-phosphate oxidase superfamily)